MEGNGIGRIPSSVGEALGEGDGLGSGLGDGRSDGGGAVAGAPGASGEAVAVAAGLLGTSFPPVNDVASSEPLPAHTTRATTAIATAASAMTIPSRERRWMGLGGRRRRRGRRRCGTNAGTTAMSSRHASRSIRSCSADP